MPRTSDIETFPYLNLTAAQAFGLDLYAGLLRVLLGIVVLYSAKSRNGRTIKVNKNNYVALTVGASNHLVGSSNLSGCAKQQKVRFMRAFFVCGIGLVRTPQFDKTHRVLDGCKPPRRGESSANADDESISPGAPNNKRSALCGPFLFVVLS